jgi:hypothetical protein
MYELNLAFFDIQLSSRSRFTDFLGEVEHLYFKTGPVFCFFAKYKGDKYFLKTENLMRD